MLLQCLGDAARCFIIPGERKYRRPRTGYAEAYGAEFHRQLAHFVKIGDKDGKSSEAQFNEPFGLAFDHKGNLFVSDVKNFRIRVIYPQGEVQTLAGSAPGYKDGDGAEALFNFPSGMAVDKDDNLYVADIANQRIRKISFK